MARWAPDSRTRLRDAALALIAERGFDDVTAAEIAAAAGVTERTFFRHFADKREAVFSGEAAMQTALVDGVASAPSADLPALLAAGLTAAATHLEPHRDEQRRRARLVAAHPALRERELTKLATTARALADALAARGIDHEAATLAGEVGVTVLRVAFERWTAAEEVRPFADLVQTRLSALAALAPSASVVRPDVGAEDGGDAVAMKRSPALQGLSRDHHVALGVALTLKRAEPDTAAEAARALGAFLAGDGDRHFRLEEELLVPALPPALARRLVDEHERLRRDAAALADEPDLPAVRAAGALLADHVRFEEREAFPALEATLTDAELEELGAALDAVP